MDLNSSVPSPLCAKGCGFYGSKENKNMCSKCYKDFLKSQIIKTANKSHKSIDVVVQKPGDSPIEPNRSLPVSAQSGTSLSETNTATSVDSHAETQTSSTATRVKNRCENCNKKVGLTGFKCRCGHLFCRMHRYPNEHACTFDFKKADREILAKNNSFIKADKLTRKI